MNHHQKQKSSFGNQNYVLAYILLFVILFSAVLNLLIETYSANRVFGSVFSPDGQIRETPLLFLLCLILILFFIFWGYWSQVIDYFNFLTRNSTIGKMLIRLIGSVLCLLLLVVSYFYYPDLYIIECGLIFLLFMYSLLHYVRISSLGFFNTFKSVPLLKKLSDQTHRRILFALGIIMIFRLVIFELLAPIDFLRFFSDIIAIPFIINIVNIIENVFTSFYDLISSLLSQFNFDFLTPLVNWVSTIETLVVKFVVYSRILFIQMESVARSTLKTVPVTGQTGKITSEASSSIKFSVQDAAKTAADAGSGVVEQIGGIIDESKSFVSKEYWKLALSIFTVFFLEGIFILLDLDMGTSFKGVLDFSLSLIIWILVVFASVKKQDSQKS